MTTMRLQQAAVSRSEESESRQLNLGQCGLGRPRYKLFAQEIGKPCFFGRREVRHVCAGVVRGRRDNDDKHQDADEAARPAAVPTRPRVCQDEAAA